jgi:hypothetical protein
VLKGLFTQAIAQNTCVRVKLHIPPFKDVPCAQSIFNEKPKENFMLWLATTFPEPFVNRVQNGMANHKPINLVGSKTVRAPIQGPLIFIIS